STLTLCGLTPVVIGWPTMVKLPLPSEVNACTLLAAKLTTYANWLPPAPPAGGLFVVLPPPSSPPLLQAAESKISIKFRKPCLRCICESVRRVVQLMMTSPFDDKS